jgi:hypothetical protein
MTRLAFIPLETDWQIHFIFTGEDSISDKSPIKTNLSEWEPLASQNTAVWLKRDFDLALLDECARYLLHIDALPGAISVVLGDKPVGDGQSAPLVFDVTEYVALEDNTLWLRLSLATIEAGNALGPVWLEAVPCD